MAFFAKTSSSNTKTPRAHYLHPGRSTFVAVPPGFAATGIERAASWTIIASLAKLANLAKGPSLVS
jgi:hypothetical protein